MTRKRLRVPRGPLVKAAELAIAAPQVVAIRTARMLAAGKNPSAKDRAEFSRMHTEKVQALGESIVGVGLQVARLNQECALRAASESMRLWTSWCFSGFRAAAAGYSRPAAAAVMRMPSVSRQTRAATRIAAAALAPIHKRATANARRLGQVKKR